MRISILLIALSPGFVQLWGQTTVDLRTQSKNVDFSQAASTKPMQMGTGLPASCSQGQAYVLLGGPAEKSLYLCTSTNTWTAQGAASLSDLEGVSGIHGTSQSLQAFGGGALNPDDCAMFDSSGNLVSAGAPCSQQPANYSQSFTAVTSVTLAHNLGSFAVLVQCYDQSNNALEYGSLTGLTVNTVAVTFATPQSGSCVVSGGATGSGGSSGLGTVATGIGLLGDGSTSNPVTVDTTAVPQRLTGTGSLVWSSIAQSACVEQAITVTGAASGDEVMVGAPADLDQGFLYNARVSNTDTVTLRLCKITSGTVTPFSGFARTWRATIVRSF